MEFNPKYKNKPNDPAAVKADLTRRLIKMGKKKNIKKIGEASFLVDIDGLGKIVIDGTSAGEIKSSLRKKLRSKDDLRSIDRVGVAAKKKHFMSKAKGKGGEENDVNEVYTYNTTKTSDGFKWSVVKVEYGKKPYPVVDSGTAKTRAQALGAAKKAAKKYSNK